MKKIYLIILIFALSLLSCSLAYAQSHRQADEYFDRAHDLEEQGRFLEAAKMYEKSAEAEKAGLSPRMEALAFQFLSAGHLYERVAKHDNALKNYEESLVIYRRLGREDGVAASLNNIGGVYFSWGQYDKALKYLEEALTIDRKFGSEFGIARELSNIGMVYDSWGRYDKALKYLEEALVICRKLGREDAVSGTLNSIGAIYVSLDQDDKALKYYEESLVICRKLGLEDSIANRLNNIAGLYYSQSNYTSAIKNYIESISIKEKLRKTAPGVVRRDYLASQLHTYQWLAFAYIRDYDISNAFQTIELSRAKLMAEWLARDESKIQLPSVKQIQETLDNDTVVLVYANVEWEGIIEIAITREGVEGRDVSGKSFVKSSIDKYDKPIKILLENQRGITVTKKDKKDQLLSDRTETKSDFDNIINYYRFLLKNPSLHDERGVEVIGEKYKENRIADARELGKALYDLLIKPMEAQVMDKKNIIIVPDGVLAFVPFETLIDEEGKYLVESYHVNYVQSMGIRKFLSERQYREDRKPLLAFGGAVYDEVAYNDEMIENETQLAYLTKNIYADLENKRSVRNAYGALGLGTWGNLPGTLNEVRNIKNVIKKADIFTGSNVTEKDIKDFSRNGKLSEYKVLHFATHGLVVPEMPELSAVVLSQFKDEQGKEDGYVRMGEIAELDIKADFVNLSACETGLGKIYGGEGVVGLTQSFILAGANAVSVSLWQVADESTSQFMVAMYDRVQDKDISYAVAMTEVKRRFINGVFGEKYKAPYYWAPFVYYGNWKNYKEIVETRTDNNIQEDTSYTGTFSKSKGSEVVVSDGSIRVESEPRGAKIYLDGDNIGYTPDSVKNIVSGTHKIEVKMDGFKVWSKRVDVNSGGEVHIFAKLEQDKPLEYTDPSTGMEFVYVKGGCFDMGDTFGDGEDDEKPVHEVCVDDFYIGKYEVTQGQWEDIMGNNPSKFKNGHNYPVEMVSWDDVQNFINRLNERSGNIYRLPTEAEWEYAARGRGKRQKFAGFSNANEFYRYANFCDVNCIFDFKARRHDDGYSETSLVGSYKQNDIGLYDMTGNVYEWVQDWYSEDYYKESPKNNPKGPSSGSTHLVRGGCWYNHRSVMNASSRCAPPEDKGIGVGFRLVRPSTVAIKEVSLENSISPVHTKKDVSTAKMTFLDKPGKFEDKHEHLNLRSAYNKKLSVPQLQELPHIAIGSNEKWGFYGHSTIQHNYEMKRINGEKVVIDHATNLMWHQSGSNDNMKLKSAKKWIRNLNSRGYAGYSDWRLPTVDEAASLLESSKKNGDLYIDAVFDKKQSVIRTGDSKGMAGVWCWFIRFNEGAVRWKTISSCNYYIRPVRSGNIEPKPAIQKSPVTIRKKPTFDKVSSINLRSFNKKLAAYDVSSISNISIRENMDRGGFLGHSTINHSYDLKSINGDKVVIDHATGLMWHQSGSNKKMKLKKAKKWTKNLNSRGYAGYSDWRLPTVDEAASLLDSSKMNGLYIDPIFSNKQSEIWTGDNYAGFLTSWVLSFSDGGVYWCNSYASYNNRARPVRSMK